MKKIFIPALLFCGFLVAGCGQKVDLVAQNQKCQADGKISDDGYFHQVNVVHQPNPDDYSFYHFYSPETTDCLTVRIKKTTDFQYVIEHNGVPLRKDIDAGALLYCSEFGVRNVLLDKFRNLKDVNAPVSDFTDDGNGGLPWDFKSKVSKMTPEGCLNLVKNKLKELKISDDQIQTIHEDLNFKTSQEVKIIPTQQNSSVSGAGESPDVSTLEKTVLTKAAAIYPPDELAIFKSQLDEARSKPDYFKVLSTFNATLDDFSAAVSSSSQTQTSQISHGVKRTQ